MSPILSNHIEKVYCVKILMYKLYHLAAVSKNLLFSVLIHSQGYLIELNQHFIQCQAISQAKLQILRGKRNVSDLISQKR